MCQSLEILISELPVVSIALENHISFLDKAIDIDLKISVDLSILRSRDMQVEIIDSFEQLQNIRDRWNLVYQADSQAQFFASWSWISGYVKCQNTSGVAWFILAARTDSDGSDYVAFLPLSISVENDNELGLYSQLAMLGVTDSHHPGFICIPEYENDAVAAFVAYLQHQEIWSVFELRNIQRESLRLNRFLSSFSENQVKIVEACDRFYKDELDDINNRICPYASLPNDWDQYLQTLSSNTRQKIKRFLRELENSDELHISYVTSANVDNQIEILLRLWQSNWESRKGVERCSLIVEHWKIVLHNCFEHNCLYLPILWKGDRPLGAMAHFIDTYQKAILFFVAARDETFTDLPPGLILHCKAIHYGIQNGFKVYDFLMGNEAYKYSFGVQERYITTVLIHRKDWVHEAIVLNPRSISEAIAIAEIYHREGHLNEAKKRYQQILASQPEQPAVLYNLAVIMQRQGDYVAAETLLKKLLKIQPANTKIWFSLGTLYQQQDRLSAAIDTYKEALNIAPTPGVATLAIYHNLGYALQQQEDWNGAIECYQKARELDPTCAEAEVMWANALHVQGRLSTAEKQHYATVNYTLGHKRRQAGDTKAAIEYYHQAVSMQPNWAEAYHTLGFVLEESKESSWDDVIDCYQKAQALAPNSVEIDASLANALFAQGKLPVEKQALYAVINHNLGDRHKQKGDWETASHYYRKAIALKPDCSETYYNLGLALQKTSNSNLDESIACYQKARALAPDSLKTDVGLANALFAQGKLSPEKLAFYACLNSDLGHQYKQAGDLELAIDHYRQAVAMDPNLAEVRNSLRLALQEQGNVQIKVSVAK